MNQAFAAIRALALVALIAGAGPEPANAGQKALLIGAGDYPHLPQRFQLPGPANDVQEMKSFLVREWGFSPSDVRVLTDNQATKEGILHALEVWLPETTVPGDRVVVYYSGHGSQVPDENGDEEDGLDETFVPTDYGRNGNRDEDMVIDDELAAALQALRDRQVLLVADSCHSGTVTRGADFGDFTQHGTARPRYYPSGARSRSINVIRDEEPMSEELDIHLTLSAALPHQLAWESNGSGIFTSYLIEALTDMRADLNGNGRLTSAELINFVKPRTEGWCEGAKECRERDDGFSPNLDPKNETFVLQPVVASGDATVVGEEDVDAVSDVLPVLDEDAIAIDIRPGNRHEVGDEVAFVLTSAMDGHLTLLDLNASDELVLLFPTIEDIDRGKSGRILANRPLTVPDKSYGFAFVAEPPAGEGRLIAIVTKDRVDLASLLDAHREFEPIDDKLDFVKSIAGRLYEVWTGDEENRGAKWAVSYAPYWISE